MLTRGKLCCTISRARNHVTLSKVSLAEISKRNASLRIGFQFQETLTQSTHSRSLSLSLSLSLSFVFRNWRANSLIRKKAAALCEVSLRLPSSLLLTSPFWLSSYSYAQVSFGEGGKMRLGKTSVSYLILSYLALVVIRRRKDS